MRVFSSNSSLGLSLSLSLFFLCFLFFFFFVFGLKDFSCFRDSPCALFCSVLFCCAIGSTQSNVLLAFRSLAVPSLFALVYGNYIPLAHFCVFQFPIELQSKLTSLYSPPMRCDAILLLCFVFLLFIRALPVSPCLIRATLVAFALSNEKSSSNINFWVLLLLMLLLLLIRPETSDKSLTKQEWKWSSSCLLHNPTWMKGEERKVVSSGFSLVWRIRLVYSPLDINKMVIISWALAFECGVCVCLCSCGRTARMEKNGKKEPPTI